MRAFIAIELPAAVKHRLGDQIAALQGEYGSRSVRWAKPDTTHLTLRFLGEIDDFQLQQVREAMIEGVGGIAPFEFEIDDVLGCFPAWKRPRVFWIGISSDDGNLEQLNGAVERELRRRGFEAEQRPYHPHLTVGRVKRSVDRSEAGRIARELQNVRLQSPSAVQVNEVSLMKSDLRPTGAVHTRIHSVALRSDGR